MKAPRFWAEDGRIARLLDPLGEITRRLTGRRLRKPGYSPGVPVICVGNVGVGGSGKTIVALDLLRRLPGRPFALTRGYKGRVQGPILVAPLHDARDVGDEALLLAAVAPTIVARDRAAGARLAVAQGASAIVMDDGLQNPSLEKTVSLMVIDGAYGFGNGRLLPAGPLREPVMPAAQRCQAAVLIGPDRTGALDRLPKALPVLRAKLKPFCEVPLQGVSVVAFAGIGRPEKFFEAVKQLGAKIELTIAFPDHHFYTPRDIQRLITQATERGAKLATTPKDLVKLPQSIRPLLAVPGVELEWEDEDRLRKLLSTVV